MPLDQPIVEHLPTVQGELTYLAKMAERARTYTYDPGPGIPRSNLEVETHTVRLGANGLEAIPCPSCRHMLAIHQPDPQWPDPLLGVCGGCGDWYLLGVKDDSKEALAVPLFAGGALAAWLLQNAIRALVS